MQTLMGLIMESVDAKKLKYLEWLVWVMTEDETANDF